MARICFAQEVQRSSEGILPLRKRKATFEVAQVDFSGTAMTASSLPCVEDTDAELEGVAADALSLALTDPDS